MGYVLLRAVFFIKISLRGLQWHILFSLVYPLWCWRNKHLKIFLQGPHINGLLLYFVINGVCSTDEGKLRETSQNRTWSEHMHLAVQCPHCFIVHTPNFTLQGKWHSIHDIMLCLFISKFIGYIICVHPRLHNWKLRLAVHKIICTVTPAKFSVNY